MCRNGETNDTSISPFTRSAGEYDGGTKVQSPKRSIQIHLALSLFADSNLSSSDKSLIWSDLSTLRVCGVVLSLRLLFLFLEDRASSSRSMFERRLISLIFAGRDRLILIRRELPLTSVASPAKPVA